MQRLELGSTCNKGLHVMRSEDDWYTYRDKSRSCRRCKREKDMERKQAERELRQKSGAKTRYTDGKYMIHFKCGHENCYTTPLPLTGSTVFCMQCREYSEVLRWGVSVGRFSSVY